MTTSTEARLDSYAALNDSLQGRNLASRKLGNNTYALRLPSGDIAIRLHDTNIVTFTSTGQITLDAGGWYTDVTLERINAHLPERVRVFAKAPEKGQVNGRWHLNLDGRGYVRFYDGISFGWSHGMVESISRDPGTAAWDNEDFLTEREILGYTKDFTGDYDDTVDECGSFDRTERTHERDHLLAHLGRAEYPYSLLYAALTEAGYKAYLGESMHKFMLDTVRKCLRKYLRRHLYLGATRVRPRYAKKGHTHAVYLDPARPGR